MQRGKKKGKKIGAKLYPRFAGPLKQEQRQDCQLQFKVKPKNRNTEIYAQKHTPAALRISIVFSNQIHNLIVVAEY